MVQIFRGLIILGLVLTPMAAHAEKTNVGVFPLQSVERSLPSRELDAISKQLLSQVEQLGKFNVIKKAPLTGAPIQPDAADWTTRKNQELIVLHKHLKKATELMKNSQFEKAVPELKKGIKRGVGAIRWPKSFALIARMCGLLSLSYLQLGQNDAGEYLLKALAVLQPNPLPPEIQKNRIMLFRYKRSIRDIRSSERGSIQILGMSGVDVYMDGKKQGQIPTVVANLPVGIHYLQVQRPGYIPWGKAIRVGAGTYQVKVSLQPIPQKQETPLDKARQAIMTNIQLLNFDHDEFRSAVRTVCQEVNTRWLLTGNIKKGGRHYIITPVRIDCVKFVARQYEPLQLDGELLEVESKFSKLTRKLLLPPRKTITRPVVRRRIVAIRNPARRLPPVGGGTKPKAKSIAQQWWFWTIIGVTVAGAGTATAIVLLQPPRVNVSAVWATE